MRTSRRVALAAKFVSAFVLVASASIRGSTPNFAEFSDKLLTYLTFGKLNHPCLPIGKSVTLVVVNSLRQAPDGTSKRVVRDLFLQQGAAACQPARRRRTSWGSSNPRCTVIYVS